MRDVRERQQRLQTIGLELSYPKLKCYIAEEHQSDMYHQARLAAGINEGTITTKNGDTLYGLKA